MMSPEHQARFSNLVKSDGAGVACLSAAKHRLPFCSFISPHDDWAVLNKFGDPFKMLKLQ